MEEESEESGLKNLIPGYGNKSVRKKIQDLEQEAGTLPVIFALLFTEAIKVVIRDFPVPFIEVYSPIKYLVASIIVAVMYVYEDKRRKASRKTKDGAKAVKERAVNNQQKISDYE